MCPEIYIIALTNVTPINSIRRKSVIKHKVRDNDSYTHTGIYYCILNGHDLKGLSEKEAFGQQFIRCKKLKPD